MDHDAPIGRYPATISERAEAHPGASLAVGDGQVPLLWAIPDPRAAGSHDDLQEATEEGAAAIAITLVRNGSSLDVVRRSRKGRGFDYYLGPRRPGPPFSDSACLEVSGILHEDDGAMASRCRSKLRQVQRGGLGLPGVVVVVGFRQPGALVETF